MAIPKEKIPEMIKKNAEKSKNREPGICVRCGNNGPRNNFRGEMLCNGCLNLDYDPKKSFSVYRDSSLAFID